VFIFLALFWYCINFCVFTYSLYGRLLLAFAWLSLILCTYSNTHLHSLVCFPFLFVFAKRFYYC